MGWKEIETKEVGTAPHSVGDREVLGSAQVRNVNVLLEQEQEELKDLGAKFAVLNAEVDSLLTMAPNFGIN